MRRCARQERRSALRRPARRSACRRRPTTGGRAEAAARTSSESASSLAAPERAAVLEVLHEPRFVDLAPRAGLRQLARRGALPLLGADDVPHPGGRTARCASAATSSATRPTEPELLATGPNQVWSWDITKLLGPAKWTYFYLYVILDIFSRYVVGWMVARRRAPRWPRS